VVMPCAAVRSGLCAPTRLIELGDSEAIDLFLREEDAQAALDDVLHDEPGWAGTLTVEPIELDEREMSAN
jgi:hypothetical protein